MDAGSLLYIENYDFANGSSPKNKYLLVLHNDGAYTVVLNLTTSKDHIPSGLKKSHGCIACTISRVSCYFFEKQKIISDNGFSFPRETFIYAEQSDCISMAEFHKKYEGKMYTKKCDIHNTELSAIKHCFKTSNTIKKKISKLL